MRYQLYSFENGRTRPGMVIDVEDRPEALAAGRALHGANSRGVQALDVECSWCEDKPVPNAERWINGNAPATAPCPRCGKGGE